MRTVGMVVAVVMLLNTRAHANDALLASQLRIARDAAAHDHCDVVGQIGAQVSQADAAYYSTTFSTDPAIAPCLLPGAARPHPPAWDPPPATTVQKSEHDADKILFFGFVGAVAGVVLGALAGNAVRPVACSDTSCNVSGLEIGGAAGAVIGGVTGVAIAF